jgi:phosphoribosyl 1,2-cyclic phosphodiesterase
MIVRLWGTRGSLASSGPETAGYGGNTASVEIVGADGTILALDAGTGIRRLGAAIDPSADRVDILLTHLHMDHIQGLGFFAPFFRPSGEIHVWGPASATMELRTRLTRYLSPPLFPVRIRDLDARVVLHDAPDDPVSIGGFEVVAQHVIHPGPTVGYRITADGASVAYLPDHEPALGAGHFPEEPRWTSGFDLASGVDLLIHDGQYSDEERVGRIGWGHSSVSEAVAFAELAKVRRLILFHHDPSHSDAVLDELTEAARARGTAVEVVAGREGATYELHGASRAPLRSPKRKSRPGTSRDG